jgi:hypothetical protein
MANHLTKGQPATQKQVNGIPKSQPEDHEILIRGIKTNGDLILSDNGKTTANSDDTITWDIEEGAGVMEILALPLKDIPGNEDVFENSPTKKPYTNRWKGKLKKVTDTRTELYSIIYKRDDGQIAIFDPIIQVNP